jgi:23S rRNA (cytidine1920-2'-O)/16S rRNA (cytidine1409-2'-O)-methyltransferase
MSKQRLDNSLVALGLVSTRSQAESYIKLGKVRLGQQIITKPGYQVDQRGLSLLHIDAEIQYVSRAALKLDSIAAIFKLDFKDKIVLDVGSSTGGFSEYAIGHGAEKVFAVEKGTDQLHPKLRNNPKIELHEKTDIRDFIPGISPDIVLIDVSFIPLRDVLPHLLGIISKSTQVIAMVKPQFEAKSSNLKHKGVIKNDRMRRQILNDFEGWALQYFIIINKSDSLVAGAKGNLERFYYLQRL